MRAIVHFISVIYSLIQLGSVLLGTHPGQLFSITSDPVGDYFVKGAEGFICPKIVHMQNKHYCFLCPIVFFSPKFSQLFWECTEN